MIHIISILELGIFARFARRDSSQPVRVSTFISGPPEQRAEQRLFISVSGRISVSGKERRKMAIADSKALLAEIILISIGINSN